MKTPKKKTKRKKTEPVYRVTRVVELNDMDFKDVCTILNNADPALHDRFVARSRGLRASEIVYTMMMEEPE